MMAAITAAEQGGSVTLLEPNERLGKKLNITGKGRCNVTNDADLNMACLGIAKVPYGKYVKRIMPYFLVTVAVALVIVIGAQMVGW